MPAEERSGHCGQTRRRRVSGAVFWCWRWMLRLALARTSAVAAAAALPESSSSSSTAAPASSCRWNSLRPSRSSLRAARDPLSSGLVREGRNPGVGRMRRSSDRKLGATTSRAFSAVATVRLNNTVFFPEPPSFLGRLLSRTAFFSGRLPSGRDCRPRCRRVLAAPQESAPAPRLPGSSAPRGSGSAPLRSGKLRPFGAESALRSAARPFPGARAPAVPAAGGKIASAE